LGGGPLVASWRRRFSAVWVEREHVEMVADRLLLKEDADAAALRQRGIGKEDVSAHQYRALRFETEVADVAGPDGEVGPMTTSSRLMAQAAREVRFWPEELGLVVDGRLENE
jgi:hypothetical protein